MTRRGTAILIWAGAAGLAVLGGLGLLRRERPAPSGPARPREIVLPVRADVETAARSRGSPEATAPPPTGLHKTGRTIRLRRPDGSYDVVEETTELLSELTSGMVRKTLARFDSVQEAFRQRFTQTLAQRGPAAAWETLVPCLRTPTSDNDDTALVFAAIGLMSDIQRDLGSSTPGHPSAYEPIRIPATLGLVTFLDSPDVDSYTKCMALLCLMGQKLRVSCAGPGEQEAEGMPTFDPGAPWEAFVLPDRSPVTPAPSNSGLQNPEVLGACLRLFQDPAAPPDIRGMALRALGACKEASPQLDLVTLSRDPCLDVGKAAVDLLGARPEAVPRDLFFSLLELRDDPGWKTLVFQRLSGPAFSTPEMMDLLPRELPSQPGAPDEYRQVVYQSTVLDLSLEQYAQRPSRELLDVLTQALHSWVSYDWVGQNSPIVTVAGFAAAHGLKEFASPLRALALGVASIEDRQSIQAAVAELDR